MIETIKKQWEAKVAIALFLLFSVCWVYLQFLPDQSSPRIIFGETYGLLALFGAFLGLRISKRWGGFNSVIGKTLIVFSLGLFAQEFGQISYAFYTNYLHIDIPYPSIGDLGFFGTIPLYIYGAYLLAKASGVKLSLKLFKSKIQAVIIPLVMLSVAYILFLRGYEFDFTNPLKIFLDFGYPFGQAIYISIGILTFSLTRQLLGGVMKNKIFFFIMAFSFQFLADYAFLYFQNQYSVGDFIDLMYLISYFTMTVAIINMESTFLKLKHEDSK